MAEEPRITERPEIPYVSIAADVTMDELSSVLPPLSGEVFAWLASHGVAPAGAPFWKYDVIDMQRGLRMEVGVPVADAVEGDGRVRAGILPAGRYAIVTHVGHPATLMEATARLLAWGEEHSVTWDASPTPDGDRWASRLESYQSEPDVPMDDWVTELAFKLAD